MDYFALLDQPREAWLDLEKLKQAFHEKSRRAHPDAGGTEATFAQVNEAYRTLQDPKRRLQYLLELEGASVAGEAIAHDIAELFQSVASASQEAEGVVLKFSGATNPLSRSLLQQERERARARVGEVLDALQRLQRGAEAELKAVSDSGADRIREWQRLHGRFAYLRRWLEQLEEKQAQLSVL